MSSLLGDAALVAATLNQFHQVGDAYYRTNQVSRTHHVLDVSARCVPLLGCVHLCQRNPEIAFEGAEGQADWLFGPAQNKPASLVHVPAVTQESRQAIDGN